jgi:hypothetical protein
MGWGEMSFAYCWDSTSGLSGEAGYSLPDLEHCVLFEVTAYSGNVGHYENGWYFPPNPPFSGWKFRDPTDGRTAPVGMECFPASNARAWDRHKRAGRLLVPADSSETFVIRAEQTYWFHCEICGVEEPLCSPHLIERRFEPQTDILSGETVWRYSLRKHNAEAWLDINREGYVADSAGLGFGPWEATP